MKLIFRTEKPAQPGCPSAHPEQAPKLAQVKLIPEARSEPTGPPPDRHYYCSWPTRGGESIPSPCSWSQAHQAALQLPRSQKHSSKAKWLWDNKTPPLKSMGFIGIAQGWFSRRFSAYVLACPSVGKETAQKQTGQAENRRLRKKKQICCLLSRQPSKVTFKKPYCAVACALCTNTATQREGKRFCIKSHHIRFATLLMVI